MRSDKTGGAGDENAWLGHALFEKIRRKGKRNSRKLPTKNIARKRRIQRETYYLKYYYLCFRRFFQVFAFQTKLLIMLFPIRYKRFTATINPAETEIAVRNAAGILLGTLPIADCRAYLVGDQAAAMTLNAAVHIARFTAEKTKIPYQPSARLRGTGEDYRLIIPNEVIAGIGLLQAAAGIAVDGLPGPQFIRTVMRQLTTTSADLRLLKFMDESANTLLKDEQGTLKMPAPGSPPSRFYDYFRRLVLLRNGLWSDEPNITNILGLRSVKPSLKSTWDDTLVVCWKDDAGDLHCHQYIGTTEPGNTNAKPSVPPQTYLMRAGYHKAQQPGGRGFRIAARDAQNRILRYDLPDSRGINFHPGGSTGATKMLAAGSLPGGTATGEQAFRKNVALSEIFSTLARWGFSAERPSYQFLAENAGNPLIAILRADDNTIVVQHLGISKTLDVKTAIEWMTDYWIRRKKQPETLMRILRSVDNNFKIRPGVQRMTIKKWNETIQPAHVQGIVEKQMRFLGDLQEVDGRPGDTYLSILDGKIPDLQQQTLRVRQELTRVNDLFKTPGITTKEVQYLKQICFNTIAERAKLVSAQIASSEDKSSFEVNEEVRNWSVACQVVFGAEQFYTFWRQVTGQALQTGQRQWYYTLIDKRTLNA
jgi:hypothetical protein